jgi:hypothetical protein
MKPTHLKDEAFYNYVWKHREHFCQECGAKINFSVDSFHHILPKAKYPYFRHDERNVVLLCGKFGCHAKAESATSYPKMGIFTMCENRKQQLLEEVGLEYSPKINQTA